MADIQARLEAMRQWLDTDRRCQWPEQKRYEVLRSVVLYGQSPAERARGERAAGGGGALRRPPPHRTSGRAVVAVWCGVRARPRPPRTHHRAAALREPFR